MKKLLALLAVFTVVLLPIQFAKARGGGRGGGGGRSGGGSRMGGSSRSGGSKKGQKEEQERKQRENKAGLLRDAREDTV